MRPTVLLTAATLCLLPEILPAQSAKAPRPAGPPRPFTAAEEALYLRVGEQASRLFFAGEADSLLALMSAETAEELGGVDGLRQMMSMIAERAGVVVLVLDKKMTRREGQPQYWYEVLMSDYPDEPVVLRWILDPDGKLVGVGITPRSRARADGIEAG